MQTSKHSSATKGGAQRYKESLQKFHSELKADSQRDFSTGLLLRELDELLDYCSGLESPERESVFVEEVCRMGRVFNVAA